MVYSIGIIVTLLLKVPLYISYYVLTVSDSIQQRPILQMEEELKQRRKQKLQLESAYFLEILFTNTNIYFSWLSKNPRCS